jgi:hypothetical protein
MTRRVHELGEAFHFGNLTGDRIVMEAMTNFDAGTQLDDVLQYIHRRLTLLEQGDHSVNAFGIDAFTLIPSFTIDAIKLEHFEPSFTIDARVPVTPTAPSPFTADAVLMPQFSINAIIERESPIEIWHQDSFTNDWIDSWGDPDTTGDAYEYDNDAHEDASDKIELTLDVTDPDFPDYVGRYIEEDKTYYTHTAGDGGLTNKTVTFLINNGRGTDGMNKIRFEFRGPTNYLEYEIRGSGQLGVDAIRLVTESTSRDFFDDQILGAKWSGYKYFQVQAVEGHVRGRVWGIEQSQPDWQVEYRSATPIAGRTGVNWRGTSWVLVVLHPNGRPWTHDMKQWEIESRGGGRMLTDAFIQPWFTADALLTRGGVWRVDAFIQPYFTMDAKIVIRTEDSFTADAVIPLLVTGNPTIDAFIQPYFNIDAWFYVPQFGSFTIDAELVYTFGDDLLLDGVIVRTQLDSFTADTITEVPIGPLTYVLDAWIAYGGGIALDAYVLDTRILIDAIFKDGQTGSFPVDSRVVDPELLREFFIDAYIPPPAGSFTTDAILKKVNDHIVHWDDFDNRVTTANLGVPSHRGRYTYSANEQQHTVSGGVWNHSSHATGGQTNDIVYLADVSGNVDRDVYWEVNYEPNSGISIGNHYLYIAGNLRFRWTAQNNAAWVIQYQSADTGFSLTPGTNDWIGMHAVIYDEGKKLKWKLWPRASGEPGPWMQWVDMEAQGWTITDAVPYWHTDDKSWFGDGDPPFDHDHDNITIELPSGVPFAYTAEAVTQDTIGNAFTVDALTGFIFSADAFIQPYFTADARIWLGTTFSMDAIIKTEQLKLDGHITFDWDTATNVGGDWTHTAPARAQAIVIVARAQTTPSAITYGNKALTNVGSNRWYLEDVSGRDDDVVRLTGSFGNHHRSSVIMSSEAPITYADLDQLTGISGAGDKTVTMQDTITGPAVRASVQAMYGNKGDPTGSYTPYNGDGIGYDFGDGVINANPITGYSGANTGNIDTPGDPDTTDITAGFYQAWSKFQEAYFIMMQAEHGGFIVNANLSLSFSADAFIQPYFTMGAWIKTPQSDTFTADAVIGVVLGSFTADAVIDVAEALGVIALWRYENLPDDDMNDETDLDQGVSIAKSSLVRVWAYENLS